jgi:hypothetical protein
MRIASVVTGLALVGGGLAVSLLAQAGGGGSRAPAPKVVHHAGSFPETFSVAFRPGDTQLIVVETTFGTLVSKDDGATFRWTCEESAGVSVQDDPVYAVSTPGTIFITSKHGLEVSRDLGCGFTTAAAPLKDVDVSDVQVGPDGAVWATTKSATDNDLFVSRDDGQTFTSAGLAAVAGAALWTSVRVAPSNKARLYVSGSVTGPTPDDGGPAPTLPVVYRVDAADATATFTKLPFGFTPTASVTLLGVSPVDPQVVYVREDEVLTDRLLRSEDGGQTFATVLTLSGDGADVLGFAISNDGQKLVAGSLFFGNFTSADGGKTWAKTADAGTLKMRCAGRRPADDALFACGANWNPDQRALARSATDGTSWSKVVRFIELAGDLECPAGSEHAATCAPLWPGVATGFGIGPDAGPELADGGTDAFVVEPPPPDDCGCSVAPLAAFLGWPGLRRRRRRREVRSIVPPSP